MTGCAHGQFRVGPADDPDRYMVGATVAAGAEGILFRGSTSRAGVEADVAVKMLQPRLLPRVDQWHKVWDDQVHLLRSLQTPGVVAVREGFLGALPHPPGEAGDDRTLYLVMNWVDGEPLDEWVRRRPDRDPFDALNLLLGVATALDLMHSGHFTRAPIVHRDVKPANILVTDQGTVLVDFGLTRALPDGPRLSGVTGTAGYLAPEATDVGEYTPATDRYALGAVGYFVFTGTEPPQSHQPDVLRASLAAVPALADQPEAVDHLMAMLDEDPSARPHPLSNWVAQIRRSTLGDPVELPATGAFVPGPAPGAQAPPELQGKLSTLAETLIALENNPDLGFVRAQAPTPGPTGEAARRITAALDEIWLRYPGVEGGGDARDGEAAPELMADLQQQTEQVAAEAGAFARAALEALSRLEAADAALAELRRRAEAVASVADRGISAAFQSVTDAETALAQDLSSTGLAEELDRVAADARRCVEHVEKACTTLPDRLQDARSELAGIEKLIATGAEAYASATEKILVPVGLRTPLDPACLHGEDPALRPWLVRIEGHVGAAQWRIADEELHKWGWAASDLRAQASDICEANAAPVAARNELRGLLAVYLAMAGTMGLAEDPVLCQLHEEACDALYVAPCDLAGADRAVRIYVEAVNGKPPEEGP